MAEYDYVICGGGIAGLYAAYKISIRVPSAKIALLYDGLLGGKIATQTIAIPRDNPTETYVIELGANKFSRSHTLLMRLLIDLGLTHLIVPYGKLGAFSVARTANAKTRAYIHMSEGKDKDGYFGMQPEVQVDFDIGLEMRSILRTIDQLKIMPAELLATSMYELLKRKIYPYMYEGYLTTYDKLSTHKQAILRERLVKLIHCHGMDADFMSLCAWSALNLLKTQYLYNTIFTRRSADQYAEYITLAPDRGGMAQIVLELARFLGLNQNIILRKLHVTHIDLSTKTIKARELQSRSFHEYREFRASKNVIVAIPAENLQQIISRKQFFDKSGRRVRNKYFRQISSHPLCVIYAKIKFENHGTLDVFSASSRATISRDINKCAPSITITVNNPIKQLIPVDYDNQIYMIYCDASVARTWGKTVKTRGEDNIRTNVVHFLEEIGFTCDIEWTWTKYWPHGIYYWKPKSDPLGTAAAVVKKLNIVGACFAVDQTTIEGALSTVEQYLTRLAM